MRNFVKVFGLLVAFASFASQGYCEEVICNCNGVQYMCTVNNDAHAIALKAEQGNFVENKSLLGSWLVFSLGQTEYTFYVRETEEEMSAEESYDDNLMSEDSEEEFDDDLLFDEESGNYFYEDCDSNN